MVVVMVAEGIVDYGSGDGIGGDSDDGGGGGVGGDGEDGDGGGDGGGYGGSGDGCGVDYGGGDGIGGDSAVSSIAWCYPP